MSVYTRSSLPRSQNCGQSPQSEHLATTDHLGATLLLRFPHRQALRFFSDVYTRQLYKQLVDPESGSTRAILLRDDAMRLPGTTKARIAAVCEPHTDDPLHKHPGVFYPRQPDATLAVFNSPFGPDVLVATDRLSEGVDLHRFCRHIIHHELDPSPVRTVQRNGRLRRVNSWAARTKQPIRVLYPGLQGTRDEKLVEIVRYRLLQFDLLLGGVRAEADPEATTTAPTTAAEILDHARGKLGRIRLGLSRTAANAGH